MEGDGEVLSSARSLSTAAASLAFGPRVMIPEAAVAVPMGVTVAVAAVRTSISCSSLVVFGIESLIDVEVVLVGIPPCIWADQCRIFFLESACRPADRLPPQNAVKSYLGFSLRDHLFTCNETATAGPGFTGSLHRNHRIPPTPSFARKGKSHKSGYRWQAWECSVRLRSPQCDDHPKPTLALSLLTLVRR